MRIRNWFQLESISKLSDFLLSVKVSVPRNMDLKKKTTKNDWFQVFLCGDIQMTQTLWLCFFKNRPLLHSAVLISPVEASALHWLKAGSLCSKWNLDRGKRKDIQCSAVLHLYMLWCSCQQCRFCSTESNKTKNNGMESEVIKCFLSFCPYYGWEGRKDTEWSEGINWVQFPCLH